MAAKDPNDTPMMRQYRSFKERYPGYLLLFRMGDFYETFGDDAVTVAEALSITLTSRDKGREDAVPLAGIPIKALDTYLPRLLRRGYKVALAEQLEDPAQAKGLVERGVVRLYTQGTLFEEELLPDGGANYLAAVHADRRGFGLALCELSTGELLLADYAGGEARRTLLGELARRRPREFLLSEAAGFLRDELDSAAVTLRPAGDFSRADAERRLREHYGVGSLEGYGAAGFGAALGAAGAVLAYLEETQLGEPVALRPPRPLHGVSKLLLDRSTIDTLELVSSAGDRASSKRSLLALLDHSATPMGRRLLHRWLVAPLARLEPIMTRQAAVAELAEDARARKRLVAALSGTGDLERAVGRAAHRRAGARDLVLIRENLRRAPELTEWLGRREGAHWSELGAGLEELTALRALLERGLVEEPGRLGSGAVIARGYDEAFDRALDELDEAEEWIRNLQQTERERSGVDSLKVGFNKVFGYYLEIPRSRSDEVPEHYIRKQTLVAAERFITPELKEKEAVITRSRERLAGLEGRIFRRLLEEVAGWAGPLGELAGALARLDVITSLAATAAELGWCRPEIDEGLVLEIEEGRHPLVERHTAGPFVPNDCRLDADERQIMLLTGPNMAGKSTYIRQLGLAVVLAQVGSFVPARRMRLGLVDAVYTRVGAADDIARGLSTFMVEMTETARIVNCATPRSLLLLDEVGRGTSTSDGVAIAWAVAEHIHNAGGLGARTVFATHYHELTRLVEELPRAFNMQLAVSEDGGEVRFLHRVEPGAARTSYGVHVARLAGLPRGVVRRARALLRQFEKDRLGAPTAQLTLAPAAPVDNEPDYAWLAAELRSANPDALTPLAALNLLAQWRGRLEADGGDDEGNQPAGG
ncbi:MAG: DNA mismatch repair protein MutS [Candidatus Coatesbacteria bacterium]|nr:DNA mismatch repair protein MutS [Candidatus Coatesbacteria bacterium]